MQFTINVIVSYPFLEPKDNGPQKFENLVRFLTSSADRKLDAISYIGSDPFLGTKVIWTSENQKFDQIFDNFWSPAIMYITN